MTAGAVGWFMAGVVATLLARAVVRWVKGPQPSPEYLAYVEDAEVREDREMSFWQRINECESKVKKMTMHRSAEGLDALSGQVALSIEDLIVQGGTGRDDRLSAIQARVRQALNEIVAGDRDYRRWEQ